MTTMYDVKPGQKVSFEIYPSAILGNNFSSVTLEGVITPRQAMAAGYDIAAYHANVYPTLPSGTANDYLQYNYVVVMYESGTKVCLGIPWIKADTIQVVGGGNLTLTFDNISDQDRTDILLALSANNFTPTTSNFDV